MTSILPLQPCCCVHSGRMLFTVLPVTAESEPWAIQVLITTVFRVAAFLFSRTARTDRRVGKNGVCMRHRAILTARVAGGPAQMDLKIALLLFTHTHRLAQNSLLSRVKTTLISGVNREKKQRLEVIQEGLGLDQ